MHEGTIIRDLISMVARVMAQWNNDTLCETCFFPLGSHSHHGLNCPNPSDHGPLFATTSFVPLLCQWIEPPNHWSSDEGYPCNEPMTVIETGEDGMGYCNSHFWSTR